MRSYWGLWECRDCKEVNCIVIDYKDLYKHIDNRLARCGKCKRQWDLEFKEDKPDYRGSKNRTGKLNIAISSSYKNDNYDF